MNKKDARNAEGIKGEKTATNDKTKEHQGTVQKNQYLKGTIATSTNENNSMMGFGNINQDVEEAP
jgi:hypothetical protein